MDCPFCNSNETQVYNSRHTARNSRVWRRRRCQSCQEAFTTYESMDMSFITITKKQGLKEPYMRSKLFSSIYAACAQLPNQAETVDALTETVELRVIKLKSPEIDSADLAKVVLSVLKHYNTAAFVRYLSYRTDLISDSQLRKELKKF